jgi:putative transposase
LTLAIDVASRMVAGFYLSLEAPSAASVALAIQHVVTPKSEWLAARGLKGDWPVSGLPDVIHIDNAREFRSRALARGAAEYGVSLVHRPVAAPHYGGHIERLIGTMMGAVHLLPGTTFGNIAGRGAYDPEKHAAMTLDELERWLALQIVGRYHAEVHGSLLLPPIAAWRDAVAARRQPLRFPHDDRTSSPIPRAIACLACSFMAIRAWAKRRLFVNSCGVTPRPSTRRRASRPCRWSPCRCPRSRSSATSTVNCS